MSKGWEERLRVRTVEPAEALRGVSRGTRVSVGSGCAAPIGLDENIYTITMNFAGTV